MKEMLILEEEKANTSEELMENAVKASPVLRFRLLFLDGNKDRAIHKVDVKNLNFQDLMRHLQRGESVLIIPKLLENSLETAEKGDDQSPWYFARMW